MAFIDVSVIPMDTERVLANQTVVVQQRWITALGPANKVQVPAGATQINSTGKFLIPGLTDCHIHIRSTWGDEETKGALFLWLANGVTTARVMYGWPETVNLKKRAARAELLSPRLYVAYSHGKMVPDTAWWAMQKATGFDFLKMAAAPPVGFDSLVVAARQAGLPIVGHVVPELALPARISSIEHLTGYPTAATGIQYRDPLSGEIAYPYPGEEWSILTNRPLDEAKLRTLAAATQQAGVWNCPTQALYEMLSENSGTAPYWPELRYVLSRTPPRPAMSQNPPSVSSSRAMDSRRRIIKALHDAGAGLLLGSDAPAMSMVPGFSIHRELESFVHAGLTPYQALLTGTRNAAVFFKTLDSTGTVAVGKRADLVLLSGNPLRDIRHTQQPTGVMLGGRWLDRTTLDQGLAALESKFKYGGSP